MDKFINSLSPPLRKLIRNYNVIERADKALKKEKRDIAPRHPGTERNFRVLVKTSPEETEKVHEKKTDLVERLKEMTIEVSDAQPTETPQNKENFPQDRRSHDVPEFGYQEPHVIPEGKCTLKQALDFISKYQNHKKSWPTDKIAKTFNLQEQDVKNVIDNFKILELYYGYDKKKSIKDIALSTLGVEKVTEGDYKTKFPKSIEVTDKPEKQIGDDSIQKK